MSFYLTGPQVEQLLKPINAKRVNKDGKGFSHLEAYDVRAHLNRVFGFARWSAEVSVMEMLFEETIDDEKKGRRVSVGYRAKVELSVFSPDGTCLATYSEWAMGDAKNFPSNQRGEAHDFAMKTAESQALKRAAVNLGDQFGLSLYAKGSTNALVGRSIVSGVDANGHLGRGGQRYSVDEHVADVPPENTAAEPEPETRSVTPPAPPEDTSEAQIIAERLWAGPGSDESPKAWLADLVKQGARAGAYAVQVVDESGQRMALKTVIEQTAKMVA